MFLLFCQYAFSSKPILQGDPLVARQCMAKMALNSLPQTSVWRWTDGDCRSPSVCPMTQPEPRAPKFQVHFCTVEHANHHLRASSTFATSWPPGQRPIRFYLASVSDLPRAFVSPFFRRFGEKNLSSILELVSPHAQCRVPAKATFTQVAAE